MKVAVVVEVDKEKGWVKEFKMRYQRDMEVSETDDLNQTIEWVERNSSYQNHFLEQRTQRDLYLLLFSEPVLETETYFWRIVSKYWHLSTILNRIIIYQQRV
jgi:hypothetical protein